MAVSGRLRFEVLRRYAHTCVYCGRTPPEVKLQVDHVKPEALGGSDDPSNLVCACRECNSGKSSIPADAPLIEEVSADAVRWARAMREAAEELAADDEELEDILEAVRKAWLPRRVPMDWKASVVTFVKAGLDQDALLHLAERAANTRGVTDRWTYFCGCCWKRIRQLQDRAAELVVDPVFIDPFRTVNHHLTTRWSDFEIDEYLADTLEWVSGLIHREITLADLKCEHGADCEDVLCRISCLSFLSGAFGYQDREAVNG